MSKKNRNYVFTWNNPTNELTMHEDVKYCIYQKEKGESGTEHYQGYLELKKPMRMSAIHKWGNGWEHCSFQERKGTAEQAINYCKKSNTKIGDVIEYGLKAVQGKSSKLQNAMQIIKTGGSLKRVAEEEGEQFIKHHKGMEAYKNIIAESRCKKTKVHVFFGLTGCGKSYKAHQAYSREDTYKMPKVKDNVWFNGYDGQKCIIMDDFYGGLPMDFLLEFLDEYAMKLPTKGGFVEMRAETIFITSNKSPELWYQKHFLEHPEHKAAMFRRLDVIMEFKNKNGINPIIHQKLDEGLKMGEGDPRILDEENEDLDGKSIYSLMHNNGNAGIAFANAKSIGIEEKEEMKQDMDCHEDIVEAMEEIDRMSKIRKQMQSNPNGKYWGSPRGTFGAPKRSIANAHLLALERTNTSFVL